MTPSTANRRVIDLSRPAGDDWRSMAQRIDTLSIHECSYLLGELHIALRRMEEALARHRDSGSDEWRRRAEAALAHRQRDVRTTMGRLLDLVTERMAGAPGDDTRAARFMAAAVAILAVEQLAEVWRAVEGEEPT